MMLNCTQEDIMPRKPKIANWIRSIGPDGKDLVEVYVLGKCRRSDEGTVGHDVRVRPTSLGLGEYTMVVSPDTIEDIT